MTIDRGDDVTGTMFWLARMTDAGQVYQRDHTADNLVALHYTTARWS